MSDADSQMGGQGGETGKDPDDASPGTGNAAERSENAADSDDERTGSEQAAANAEDDPPA